MPSRIQRELAFLLTGKDVSASKTMKNVNRQISGLEKHASKAARNVGKNIEREMFILGTAAVGAIGYSVKLAGDFEAQMNTINTIVRETPEGLAKIGEGIRAMSRETGISTTELTAAYYDLVSAGIGAGQAQEVLNAASRLAIGGLATQGETVDILTTALNSYGVAQDQQGAKAAKFADIFAKAIERGKLTAADIASSFSTMGSLAATYGISVEEIGAAYAQMTAKGVPANEAMTQMNSALVSLLKVTKPMEKLQKATGKSYLAIAGRKGLVVALQEMRTDADKAGIGLMDLMGRKEGLNFLLATTGSNLEGYNANLAAMGDASGTAAEQMGERQKGLNFQMQKLKANIDDAAITIGTALLPELAALAKEGTDWIQNHQPEIKAFAKDLAGGLRDAVKWAKSLDWGKITAALQAGASFGKSIVEAFVNAPPWVQEFLAAGFIANKFTGGVVGDVIGEMGKGLIKGVLGMTAGVVNIKAGTVVGGGGMGPGGAAPAGAGRLAQAANLVSKVLIVGMVAEVAQMIAGPLMDFGSELGKDRPKEFADFGQAWNDWRANADWPFGQKNAPDWAYLGGTPPKASPTGGNVGSYDRDEQSAARGQGKNTAGAFGGSAAGFTGTAAAQLQGIYERAIAAGKNPTEAAIVATLERNQARQAARDRAHQEAVRKTDAHDELRRIHGLADRQIAQAKAIESATRHQTREQQGAASAAGSAAARVRAAAIATAAAIRDKDLSVSVRQTINNKVNINARNVSSSTTKVQVRTLGGNIAS